MIKKKFEQIEEKLDFQALRDKARKVWESIVTDEDSANAALKKIEMVMGRKMKLSEFSEDQADLLQLVINELESM